MFKFFSDHKTVFPVLWIQSQCEESHGMVQVGCERFFNLAGYISSLPSVLDLESKPMSAWQCFHAFFVKCTLMKYLRRCKAGNWKSENDEDSLKY